MSQQKPIVALVGRPNVGKSTLFNRLVGQRKAIVEDLAGTTRDRLYGDAEWAGRDFIVVDTGGLDFDAAPPPANQSDTTGFQAGVASRLFLREIREQAEIAIAEAEVIVLLVDGEAGLTSADHDVAALLRRTDKPVILAVNKADNQKRRSEAVEFYALGLGDPIPVSALHGTGSGDLLDAIVAGLPPAEMETEAEDEAIKIAILGRPNVGKSSLLNKLLGEERVIVSDVPGTTRDAIDMPIQMSSFVVRHPTEAEPIPIVTPRVAARKNLFVFAYLAIRGPARIAAERRARIVQGRRRMSQASRCFRSGQPT